MGCPASGGRVGGPPARRSRVRYRNPVGHPHHGVTKVSGDKVQSRRGGIEMAGTFEVYTDKAGKFRFRLKASNGQVIASGEAYESKAAANAGVQSVIKNSVDAKVVDLT